MTLRIRDLPSPNQDERPADTPIDMLILHYTGMRNAQEAIDRLRDPAERVSSHYVVDEDGAVLRLVPEAMRAWHAGDILLARTQRAERAFDRHRDRQPRSRMGLSRLPGAAACRGVRPLPRGSCRGIRSRRATCVAHSDVAPDRKEDPGELFDWQSLAENGVGLWPIGAPDLGTVGAARDPAALHDVRTALSGIGYRVAPKGAFDPALATVLRAFQRHWRPEAVTGEADAGTRARLSALWRLAGGA